MPLPRIKELFASVSGGKVFSKVDLSHAYLQLQLDKSSQEYVTINTHHGLYRYTCLPFGVAFSTSHVSMHYGDIAQRLSMVVPYLDDILVAGKTQQDYLMNLAQQLECLYSPGMNLKRRSVLFVYLK